MAGALRFTPGPWTGFFNYGPGSRHVMELQMSFAEGVLSGTGKDEVGEFEILGRFDPETLECAWKKHYIGKHEVSYQGYLEENGIWGTWEIGLFARGGFHIWPKTATAEPSETAG